MTIWPEAPIDELVGDMSAQALPKPVVEDKDVKSNLFLIADEQGIQIAAAWASACILNKLSIKVDEIVRDDGVILIEGVGW